MFEDFLLDTELFLRSGDAREELDLDEMVRLALVHEAITPHFQPIVDVLSGTVFGYELVSRALSPIEMPDDFLPRARRLGLAAEYDVLCLKAGLRKILTLSESSRHRSRFFLNLNADLAGNPLIREVLSRDSIATYHIDIGQLTLELTESSGVPDAARFGADVRELNTEGYSVALDDFGWGHRSFQILLACRPQYIKLNRDFVQNIHFDYYRQHLLKSVLQFASAVDATVVAEGVEYMQELEALIRLGVRFVQGYLFGMPESEPLLPSVKVMSSTHERVKRYQLSKDAQEEGVSSLVVSSLTVAGHEVSCSDLREVFLANPSLDHVVLVSGKKPTGLIARTHFFEQTMGLYGEAPFDEEPVEALAKPHELIVEDDLSVTVLAKLAMDRPRDVLYDPVIVTDGGGDFVGTVTMKQLIARSFDVEVRRALERSPLTNLPGNRSIRQWIVEALQAPQFFIVYADLSHFKEYNDVYGFMMGDKMIRLTARVLSAAGSGNNDVRVGHLGGDDFVMVSGAPMDPELLYKICETFDELKLTLFQQEHIRRGYFETADRRGEYSQVPLVTLGLAVIHGDRPPTEVHPEMVSQQAASLKKKVKQVSFHERHSTYLLDRRVFPAEQTKTPAM